MKITLCGKGGSGKSTVTALLAKELVSRGKRVLVIDCDESNYGLHQQLGMELPKTFVEYFGGKMAVMGMLSGGPRICLLCLTRNGRLMIFRTSM